MSRFTRTLAAGSVALTFIASSVAFGQATDSTRTARPPMREGMMGPGGGMRPRLAPDDDAGSRRGGMMRQGRGRSGRGGAFGPGAPGRGVGMRAGGGSRALLRGITLTTDQEKALRSAQARHIMAAKPLMLEMMSARTDQQLAQLNGDQKALDASAARLTATRTKLDSLRSQRSPTGDLRAVLTPDQQKILDKNLSERGANGRMRPGRSGSGMRSPQGIRDRSAPRAPRSGVRSMRPDSDGVEPKDDGR